MQDFTVETILTQQLRKLRDNADRAISAILRMEWNEALGAIAPEEPTIRQLVERMIFMREIAPSNRPILDESPADICPNPICNCGADPEHRFHKSEASRGL